MTLKYCLILLLLLMVASQTQADQGSSTAVEGPAGKNATKELSGMSIVGNDEAPKSLYIVPWKSSELGQEASMDMMLNERDVPVDREVFMRQLEYYEVSTSQPGALQ